MKVELKSGIHWVGAIDWNIRNFHGYSTHKGTTYNAYLVIGEKIALVDSVKAPFYGEMLERINNIMAPEEIDYLIVNHVEMDHSGSLPLIRETLPRVQILCSPRAEGELKLHYGDEIPLKVVKTGDVLELGRKSLTFVEVPMVHWPDSMVTYVKEDKVLLPNDAFGQHIASTERFDDELGWETIHPELTKYYANIVMPYGAQVLKALEALKGIEVEAIGPSHGLIWRGKRRDRGEGPHRIRHHVGQYGENGQGHLSRPDGGGNSNEDVPIDRFRHLRYRQRGVGSPRPFARYSHPQ
jgi:flavorubredoxin